MIFNNSNKVIKPDTLLSNPSLESDINEHQYERLISSYKNLSEKYVLGIEKNSDRQYYEMYSVRLKSMRPKIEKVASEKWGKIFYY